HPNAPSPDASQGRATCVRGMLVRADGSDVDDAVVAIEGSRIARVGTAREMPVPPGAAVIGGSGKWIIPGLIDAHVHFFQSGGLYTRPDVIDLTTRVSYAEETRQVRAALPETFRRYLRAGVTSVIDFGGPEWNFDMRELATRTPPAPRAAGARPRGSAWPAWRWRGAATCSSTASSTRRSTTTSSVSFARATLATSLPWRCSAATPGCSRTRCS